MFSKSSNTNVKHILFNIYDFIFQSIDQDQQQRVPPQRSTFSSFYYMACSERGHLGKRRVRLGRGGRYTYTYLPFF